ncbi:MAG TPA: cytochrome c [Gammaproteobacteria bacterium]|nr:cytochrome c [Gammaproteobacteria bacterium]
MRHVLLTVAVALVLAGCGQDSGGSASASTSGTERDYSEPMPRWYDVSQVRQGAEIYTAECAECHGKKAQGAADWQEPLPNGAYPPPPLNGDGHGWHHPLPALFYVVKNGSPGGKGNMPAWGKELSDDEILATIAWFQSRWPEKVYRQWVRIDHRARKQNGPG